MLYRIVPESPRWLIIKGRMKEAKAIINQVGLENRRPEVPDNLIISKSTGETGGQTEVDMEGESSVLTVLRCPRLGLRTLNMCYQVTHNEGWQIKLVLLLSYFLYFHRRMQHAVLALSDGASAAVMAALKASVTPCPVLAEVRQ